MGMVGPQLRRVLGQHDPLTGTDQPQQRAQQGRLAASGAAADQERQPGVQQGSEYPVPARRDCPRHHQLVEGERARPYDPQRQAGGADGHRGQHRVQAGAVRKPGVDPGAGVVEPSPGHGREALREPSYGRRVRKGDGRQLQATAPVHPHPVRRGHQDVGHRRVGEQRLQRPTADQLGTQPLGGAEDFGVSEHSPLLAQGLCHARGSRFRPALGEPLPYAVQQSRAGPRARARIPAHTPPPSTGTRCQKALQNLASGPRAAPRVAWRRPAARTPRALRRRVAVRAGGPLHGRRGRARRGRGPRRAGRAGPCRPRTPPVWPPRRRADRRGRPAARGRAGRGLPLLLRRRGGAGRRPRCRRAVWRRPAPRGRPAPGW